MKRCLKYSWWVVFLCAGSFACAMETKDKQEERGRSRSLNEKQQDRTNLDVPVRHNSFHSQSIMGIDGVYPSGTETDESDSNIGHIQSLVYRPVIDDSPYEIYDTTQPSPFITDIVHKDSLCCDHVNFLMGILCNVWKLLFQSCICKKLCSTKTDQWPYVIVKELSPMLTSNDTTQQFEGYGGFLFWDLRNSTMFSEKHGRKVLDELFGCLITHLFGPIAEKYGLKMVGMNGDGPLCVKIKDPHKKRESTCIANNITRAALEMVVRYPKIKKKYGVKGPKYCGAGCGMGKFCLRVAQIEKNSPCVIPSFSSKSVTDAHFCEQTNKELGTALVITESLYNLLDDDRLKHMFKFHTVNTKAGNLDVYAACLNKVNDLYNQTSVRETQKVPLPSIIVTNTDNRVETKQNNDTQKQKNNENDIEIIDLDN
jgi:hypothetical protein